MGLQFTAVWLYNTMWLPRLLCDYKWFAYFCAIQPIEHCIPFWWHHYDDSFREFQLSHIWSFSKIPRINLVCLKCSGFLWSMNKYCPWTNASTENASARSSFISFIVCTPFLCFSVFILMFGYNRTIFMFYLNSI